MTLRIVGRHRARRDKFFGAGTNGFLALFLGDGPKPGDKSLRGFAAEASAISKVADSSDARWSKRYHAAACCQRRGHFRNDAYAETRGNQREDAGKLIAFENGLSIGAAPRAGRQ